MNKQAELTRWTPKRLLSLLMALIMTLSLLPTAALAASDYTLKVTNALDTQLLVGQESADITATLTANSSVTTPVNVRLKVTVTTPIGTGNCTIQYENSSGVYVPADDGYLDDGANYLSVSSGNSVSAKFKLKCDNPARYSYKVEAFEKDSTAGTWSPISSSFISSFWGMGDIENLTVDPANPEAGQPFTVRADTNVNNGYVVFEYNGVPVSAPVNPLLENKGYAEYKEFTAVAGANNVKATLTGAAGIPPAEKSVTFSVGTPATYHTVTFHENAAGVYNMPPSQTVKGGDKATEPTVKPQRDGYTFGGWYKDAACTASFTLTTPVTEDLHLYAGWKKVTYPVQIFSHTTGVNVFPTTPNPAAVGETVDFNVTVPAKYDTTNMLVSSGESGVSIILAPSSQHTDSTHGTTTFYYHFEVKDQMIDRSYPANPVILILVNPLPAKTFTVMMPTGHFNAEITAATPVGSTVAGDKKSASIVYGGSYTFTVTPHAGYDVAVYVNGVKQTAGTDGKYTVPDVTGPQRVAVVESAIPNYTVTFTVPLSGQTFTQSVARGGKASAPGVAPEREGYKFDGWYTETEYKKDTGATPFDFDTRTITKDTVLYGKLTPTTYTITYYGNGNDGGTVPAPQSKTHGLAVQLSTDVPTRVGHKFLGWGTTADATAPSYQPGDMYSVDGKIDLYAVWQKNTYTITFSSGEGYSLHSIGSMTVAHGENFEFNLFVDPAYAQNKPTVYVNTGSINATNPKLISTSDAPTDDGAKVYLYRLENVTANTAINAEVTTNATYTVTFMTGTDVYQTQQVEFKHKATQPVDPKVEGFTFGGWYKNTGWTDADKWDFSTPITDNTTLNAKLTPIEPVITWPTTTTGYTIEVKGTKSGETAESTLASGDKVAYGSTVTFTITINDGYDASKMQVGVNGVLLAPKSIVDNVYTFEFTAKQDTEAISVTGVERKTVTIIYNANARDDVSDMPEAQTVKYYLDTVTDNDKIIKQIPVRTGYKFLGWNTDSKADAADPDYTVDKIEAGTATSKFTANTTLYAVWKAVDTTVSLKVTDVAATDTDTTTTPATTRYLQYEGEKITLQATLNFFAKGTVVFYKGDETGTTGEELGSTSINGKTAELTVTVGQYKSTEKDEYYWVKFEPEADEGYAGSTSAVENVGILSKAICWVIGEATASELLVYKGNSATGTPITDAMIAGQTYTLKVKTDKITGVETLDSKKPVLGKDYKIVWQYTEVGKNDWKTDGEASDKATYLVTGDKSGYQFRAQIVPLGKDHDSLYLKAAKYTTGGVLEKDQYDVCLYTKPTAATALQTTATVLEITGADDEAANVTINGNTPFTTTGEHKAQFEGKKVTLTATVTDTTAGTSAVTTGHVDFYRKGATTDTKLNASPIAVGANGVATCEVTISNWDTTKGVTENKDEFYAVYLANATYDTSNSKTTLQAVYIKSTAIKTPIIDSTLPGKLNGADANSTSYEYDLTGLLAGVEHTFKLRTGNDKADWSVVALDGRTVAAKNYTIQWITKTGDNEIVSSVTGSEFKTSDNKVGDEIYVRLNPTGDMKTGADSKKAIIGKKQDVTVAVEASDEINSTAETDVYQLNDITLTATVAAKETTSTMKPTGTVAFYYSVDNGTTWTKIGDAKDLAEVAGVMTASIQTDQLPVKAGDNTKQDVKITAVYEGNETFNASATVTGAEQYTITTATGCTTNNDTVIVYSSVVYVKDMVENKTTVVSTKTHESGIYIYAEDDKVLANEGNVNLKLSEVYTLDHDIPLSKLTYNTDYTVQWQMLTNAAAYPDKASATWTNITSATGTTCQIDVEQGAAYRAVITVKDTPIAKGSFTEVQQAIPGHKVYYSNILVAANAPATLTVNVNTDNTSKGYEGIVEGETVTIHTFTSGATGTTPISKLTVDIYEGKSPAAGATPVFTAEKANVNGHVSFDWNKDVTPGYYTLKVKATFTNGYDDKEITRTLIVRDNDYKFELSGDNAVYNGKVQDLKVTVADMGIENALAQKSVVVYYYTDEARTQQVEPTQAGTYYATVRLQESAYWTEKTFPATFTIKPREVSVVDLVAQAKVYDGTNNANIQEIILNDATVDPATGLPTDDKGIIDGDSVYAVGTGYTSQSDAGTADLGVKDVTLKGDDAANYEPTSHSYYNIEDFNIQRSQVKGAIVSGRTYKYTGKDIKLAASDIYLIDQAGNQLTDYDVTYYYHNGDGVEKVDAMNKMGKYTVIARPEQNNYKGGATETVYVGTTDNAGTLTANAVSSLITISNTVELYGAAGNKGIVATATNNATVTVQYQNGTGWSDARPTDAGRYLVKVTATNGSVTDTAYGIYTIVKARPEFTPTTDKSSMEYTSGRYDGAIGAGFVNGKSNDTAETYITYTGGTIQGVAYEAPTEVGKYIATVHVGETANYTAHEKQVAFEITPKALTITADDISRQQYGAYPDLTASFKGLATGGVAADTSLRDVQIQPELIDKSNYTNDASDQVGNNYSITAVAALARNYTVSYVDGNMSVTHEDPKPYLEIRGMIENGDGATDLAYYGDVIQLYAYGNQNKTTTGDVYNTSSVLTWEVTTGPATITQDGLLTVTGVGDVTVTLKRGIGAQQISTTLTFTAKKQEVKVVVPDQDLIYNGAEQKYDGGKFYAENAKGERITATPYMHDGKVKRTNVGSQIITSWVGDTNATYQSEHYCGLFTINVKDVTVTPKTATTTYGTAATGLTHSESNTVGGVAALTGPMAVSVADAYSNLDVLNGYEILVAGRENENYNVKYVTDQDAPDVEVTAKDLIISTGTLNEQTGMTSGSLNPMGKYPVNGAEVASTASMGAANVRMYGEPNWVMDEVMDETLATLIDGDTLADLTALGNKLVSFNYNIGADANVSYTDKSTKLTVSGSPMPDYKVFTDDSMMAFKNYTETYTLGTQNIYQRPVTLSVPSGMTLTAYKPSILDSSNQVKNDVLLNLLLNNLIVSKYNNEGGLAELLKHTIKDLDIQIKSTQVTGDKLTVKIALGNQNYWLNSANEQTFEITLVTEKIVPKYSTLDWTSFSVTMYDAEGKAPVSVNGAVNFYIFKKKDGADLKYSDYKNDPIIRSGPMTPTGSTGQYVASFERLPAGEYAYFAIAQNYTIVE